jgi:hypothetical protein
MRIGRIARPVRASSARVRQQSTVPPARIPPNAPGAKPQTNSNAAPGPAKPSNESGGSSAITLVVPLALAGGAAYAWYSGMLTGVPGLPAPPTSSKLADKPAVAAPVPKAAAPVKTESKPAAAAAPKAEAATAPAPAKPANEKAPAPAQSAAPAKKAPKVDPDANVERAAVVLASQLIQSEEFERRESEAEAKKAKETASKPSAPAVAAPAPAPAPVPAAPAPAPSTAPSTAAATPAAPVVSAAPAVSAVDAARSASQAFLAKQVGELLHAELATHLADELKHLDADQLRNKVLRLNEELRERAKWEAVRMTEFLERHETLWISKVRSHTALSDAERQLCVVPLLPPSMSAAAHTRFFSSSLPACSPLFVCAV